MTVFKGPNTLSEHLDVLRTCSSEDLVQLVSNLSEHLEERLPRTWLRTLTNEDLAICYRAILICWAVTFPTQVPREMQLRAVLADRHGKDMLISAGTGSGKTLPIALNMLLDDPRKKFVTITLSPLKRLQTTQENDFNSRYKIPTVTINEDSPRDDCWWNKYVWNSSKRERGEAWHLIVTAEQLFKSKEGHLSRLAVLLRNQNFVKAVIRFNTDEAHTIHTSGLPQNGLPAFRPSWGRLDELKVLMPKSCRWALFSATFPEHILATCKTKLLQSGFEYIRITSNRPNTTYIFHEVTNSIEDMQNYNCFVAKPFRLDAQPRVIIFVDNKVLASRISHYCDAILPLEFQGRGIVMHYHSMMSEHYLQKAHEEFTSPAGVCRILIATSGQSVGVDFPNVKIVCTVGLPSTGVDTLQRGGRAIRTGNEDALFIIFYEPWVHEISLEEYADGDLSDPDRPRAPLKLNSTRRDRAPFFLVHMIHHLNKECVRGGFAVYLNDLSSEALHFTGRYCCNGTHCFEHPLIDLQSLLPGPLPMTEPTSSSGQLTSATAKRKRNVYRPPAERPTLEFQLMKWLEGAHANDPLRAGRPAHYILSDSQRDTLIRTQSKSLASAQDVTKILNETDEWGKEWSTDVFAVIQKFNADWAAANSNGAGSGKRKRSD